MPDNGLAPRRPCSVHLHRRERPRSCVWMSSTANGRLIELANTTEATQSTPVTGTTQLISTILRQYPLITTLHNRQSTYQKSSSGSNTLFGVPCSHRLSSGSSSSRGKRVNSSFFFVSSRYLAETWNLPTSVYLRQNLVAEKTYVHIVRRDGMLLLGRGLRRGSHRGRNVMDVCNLVVVSKEYGGVGLS